MLKSWLSLGELRAKGAERPAAFGLVGSGLGAVAEVHGTAAEPVLLLQLQRDAGVAGERGLAFTDEDRIHEEVALVDQPGVERVRREGRPADGHVAGGGRL